MVQCIPPDPSFAHASEREVWQALKAGLGDSDVLLANVRFTDAAGDHEADLIVGIDGAGVVVIETKGGSVSHDGHVWSQHGGASRTIDPVAQAMRAKYVLRGFLDSDPRWKRRRLRFGHAVAFPYSRISADFAIPDCPRAMVLDRGDIAGNPAGLLWDLLVERDDPNPQATADDLADLVDILSGRLRPQRDVLAIAADHEAQANLLTERQAMILPALRLLNRVEVRGGAGSGKTWLAVEQVRRLSAAGQRVALMCYSRGLAEFLIRWVASLPKKEQPAYVGTFHGLGYSWGAEQGDDNDSGYWEEALPAAMVALARNLEPSERFDAIIIDEAQDFGAAWWPAVQSALADDEEGAIYAFFDEGQRVFARGGPPPIPLVPIVLDENVRNTKPIAQTFGSLAPIQMRYRGADGDPVRFIACSEDAAVSMADDVVDELLSEGWLPEHLALLTTGSRHPEQKARQELGQQEYWSSFWDIDQVFYGHVLGFKGLERPAVVLAVNGFGADGRGKEKLYVGLSRARDRLVVCGDPEQIRAVGGEAVYRRLVGG